MSRETRVDSHNYNCWLWLKSVNDKLKNEIDTIPNPALTKFHALANIEVDKNGEPTHLNHYPIPEVTNPLNYMLKYRNFFSTLENLAQNPPVGEKDAIKKLIKAVYTTEVPFIYIAPADSDPHPSQQGAKHETAETLAHALETKSQSNPQDPSETMTVKEKIAINVYNYTHNGYRNEMIATRATDENSAKVKLSRMTGYAKYHAMHTTCFPWQLNDDFHRKGQIRMGSQSCEDGKSVLATFKAFLNLKTQPVDRAGVSQMQGAASHPPDANTEADAGLEQRAASKKPGAKASASQKQEAASHPPDANTEADAGLKQRAASKQSDAKASGSQKQGTTSVGHVYINLLKNTRSAMTVGGTAIGKSAFERNKEVARSNALHQLETGNDTHIRVVSLPADDRVLLIKRFTGSPLRTVDQLINRAVDGILHNKHDFHFSEQSKKDLFAGEGGDGSQKAIEHKVRELMKKSAEKLGVQKGKQFNDSQNRTDITAIWFDFIKLQLTDHILDTFNPDTFNITCKDGIDRAHVHSTYYNQHRQLEQGKNRKTLTEDELHRLIHTPARLVKGRDMNKHARLLEKVNKTITAADKKSQSEETKQSNREPSNNKSWHDSQAATEAKTAKNKENVRRTRTSSSGRARKKIEPPQI